MKYILIALLLFVNTVNAYIINQQAGVKILPLYQSWKITNGIEVSEVSTPVVIYYPFNRNLSFTLRGGQAYVAGKVTTLNSITDTQFRCSYYLEAAHLVFGVGVNIPSGKKELSINEFTTSSILSINHFNFQVPNLGQGLNISPSVSWAFPWGDKFVLGLGAAYQYKGSFKPIDAMLDNYFPGDEIILTGGFDVRLAEMTTVAIDVVFTRYGTDKIGNREVFVSGNKVVVSWFFHSYFNYDELSIRGYFRSKAKNSYVIGGILQEELEKTTPDQVEGIISYRKRFSNRFYFRFMAEGRFYFQALNFPEVNIYGGGIAPEININNNFQIFLPFKYFLGYYGSQQDISGLEAGVGINYFF